METNCTCNIERKASKTCFNSACGKTWEEPVPHHIRTSECKIHHNSIAICGVSPSLCAKCDITHEIVRGAGWFDVSVREKEVPKNE